MFSVNLLLTRTGGRIDRPLQDDGHIADDGEDGETGKETRQTVSDGNYESVSEIKDNDMYVLGGQIDKLCSSVHPPSRNELHRNCISYHVFLLGK